VNFFTLEGILSNCETPQITQDNNFLRITDGKFKSSILIETLDFPQPDALDVDFFTLDEEFLHLLKTASKFTGDGLYNYIYVDKNYILSTCNREKAYYNKHTYDVSSLIGINKKIFSILSEGMEVGTLENNTVVRFGGGEIIFKIALLDNFPSNNIVGLFEGKPEVKKLCNIAPVQDAVKKVSSILHNENLKAILLTNSKNKLNIKAESIVNGVSEFNIDSEIKDVWKIFMNADALSNIDLDYDIFVDLNNERIIYLSNGVSEIALVGKNVY